MSKSIEAMWKQGFVSEGELSAPKVNDLYNRKSQNIVDKLQNMFAVNIKAIVIGALIMLLVMSLIGAPWLGLYISVLLAPLVIIAKKELTKSHNLSKGQSSLEYLESFDAWLKASIDTYSNYYRFFYPLFYIGMVTQGLVSDAGTKVMVVLLKYYPTEYVFLAIPGYIWVVITLLFLLIVRYSEALYRLDLDIIYGRQFKKLDELITDMRALKSGR
ncbi:hypothetical protein CWB72_15735 [Pseudoalteromonas phenolica]|uniref:hypothetical protein n=1 Tax=Pseudoalteromonas phenolica TaxID=161398 RepID=UPI00110A180A|nr:hypothetical protein [Pseudoalteromonas phenolica]TMN87376.1 hypothetical protein CWB72_15735 [Pseudoalteromonas phenolica]